MIDLNEHNWGESIDEVAFAQTKVAHIDSVIDWVKFHDGSFGVGLRVNKDDLCNQTGSHKKIEIVNRELSGGKFYTAFLCKDPESKKIFESLCSDLIIFCLNHPEIIKPAHAIIERAKAWEALFSKGTKGLGKQATLGLYTELLFLRDIVLPRGYSINQWIGPHDTAQDFDLNGHFVEIKHCNKNNCVNVSSLEQLNNSIGMSLCAYQIIEDPEGVNIDDMILEIMTLLPPEYVAVLNDKLLCVGYLKNKNYSASFKVSKRLFFEISPSFPHIETNDIAGVVSATYKVDLSYARECEIDEETFYERI